MFCFLPVVCTQEIPATNYKILVGTSIKMGRTKRDSVTRKTYLKFPQIFTGRTVYICGMRKSKDVSEHSWTCWDKLTFNQSFVSERKIFSFEDCRLGKKKKIEGRGTFRKFWLLRTETASVTDLN